jgi:hypothetical protein
MASLTYRGYRFTDVGYLEAPTGGWNSDQTPWLLPDNQAHVLDNFIVRIAGPKTAKATLRGSFQRIVQWLPSASTVPFGVVPAASLGINFAATVGVAPWDATLAGASGTLMVPSTTLTYYTALGSASSPITVTATTAPGCRWINFLGSLYGLGYGATSTLTDTGGTYTINANAVLKASLLGGSSGVLSQSRTFAVGSGGTAGLAQSQDSSGTIAWTEFSTTWGTPGSGVWNAGANSNLLKFSNFGFSVPGGATILGIEVVFTGGGTGFPHVPVDSSATLVGGSGTSSNLATFTPQNTTRIGLTVSNTINDYGNSSQLWGMTWSPAQINNTAFGFNWQLSNNTGANQNMLQFASDAQAFTVVVYYQTGGTNTAPVAQTGYPTGAVDITQYQSRIWLACGCDVPASGTHHEPTTIFWTNPVTSTNPLLNTAADFQYTDPVSGITSTNKVVIDNNGSDPVMGFGRITGAMIIFRRSSVYVLKGTTTANYQITKVSGDIGCLDPRSIVESDEGVYFMSLQGLMLTNGSRITAVSTGVAQALQTALAYEQAIVLGGNANPQSGWISSGITSQGHIAVSVGVMGTAAATAIPLPNDTGQSLTPTAMRTLWSGVYDPDTGSWYRLTSFLFGIDSGLWQPQTFIGVPDLPQIFVSNRLVSQRSLHVIGNAGITMLEDQALSASYLTSSAFFDTVNPGAPGSVSPEVGTIQGLGIPARWHSKMAPIVGTSSIDRRFGMPLRFFVDHAVSVSGNGTATQNYDATSSMTSFTTAISNGTGGTAWTVTTAGATGLVTATPSTPIGTVTLASAASSNLLLMIPSAMGAVPSGATITGVQVVMYKNGAAATSFTDIISIRSSGGAIGNFQTEPTWSKTPGFFSVGGPNFLWGGSPTPAQVNNGTFGIGIQVTNSGAASGAAVVYLANIIVYYTTSGGAAVSISAPSWSVTPYDSDGAAYPVTLACGIAGSTAPADPRGGPSVVSPVTANTILRDNLDFSNEISSLTFDLTLPAIAGYTSVLSGAPVIGPGVGLVSFSNVIGEVYGLGVAYQTAQDLRTKIT